MAGGLLQLVAYGVQDIYLTGNPQITYFKALHRRHTNFSMESIKQSAKGNSTIPNGTNTNTADYTISRTGDLIYRMYLEYHNDISGSLDLDNLTSTYRFNSGVNNMSSKMIKDVIIEIGGQKIDTHYGEWLEIFAELTEPNPTGSSLSEITNYIPENELKTISCGSQHTAILSNTDKVVTFGDNEEGQLGNGSTVGDEETPVDVSGGGGYTQDNAIAVSCGGLHTAILLDTGKVVTFGDNEEGQLGIGSTGGIGTPVDVSGSGGYAQDNAIAVSCGDIHTAILLNTGKVVTFGKNNQGQLGIGFTEGKEPIPVDVSGGGGYTQDNAIAVSCGGEYTAILLYTGKVVTFGYDYYGQLGNGSTDKDEPTPVGVSSGGGYTQDNAIAVSCGGIHTAILLNTGKVVTFGYNNYGQLGNGSDKNEHTPVNVNSGGGYTQDNAIAVSCGGSHTAILLDTGKVVTFGDNRGGQLGNGSTGKEPIPVGVSSGGGYTLDNAIAVSCGSNHTAILLDTGKVVTFGDNSEGQLGNDQEGEGEISSLPVDVSGGGGYHPDNLDTSGGKTLFNTLYFVNDTYSTSGTLFQKMSKMGGAKNSSYLKRNQTFVPLRFWFNRNPGLALPLIALQYHEVKLLLTLNGQDICHINSGIDISLWVDYIYLDTDERRRFAQTSHEYLIEQLQKNDLTTNKTNTLIFNHPIKELVWYQGGNTITDTNWQLILNGQRRFNKRPTKYFTRTQIWQHHTGYGGIINPDSIAVYSFAIKPEKHQPSGTCNFTRIQ